MFASRVSAWLVGLGLWSLMACAAAQWSVVGSFQSMKNAEQARSRAERRTGTATEVRKADLNGCIWYRVLVRAPVAELRSIGYRNAWRLSDARASSRSPCARPSVSRSASSAGAYGTNVRTAPRNPRANPPRPKPRPRPKPTPRPPAPARGAGPDVPLSSPSLDGLPSRLDYGRRRSLMEAVDYVLGEMERERRGQ